MKQYVIALLIASFLAISSLGIGVTVITNASNMIEDSEITEAETTCTYNITVFKYYDVEETGRYDEDVDEPLGDWYFELYGKGHENGDEDRDHGDWIYLDNGTTDENGYLVFEDWECGSPPGPMGHYKVREYIPEGWYNVGEAYYPTPEEQPESTSLSVSDNEINLEGTEDNDNNEDNYVETSFWLRVPMTVEFGNRMKDGWITVNKVDYVTEEPLEGWEFTLYTEDNDYVAEGTTDEHGQYIFEDVYPGEYIVNETLKEGWENITPLEQQVTVNPDQNTDVWFRNAIPDGDITVCKYDWYTEEPIEGWEFILLKNTTNGWEEEDSGFTNECGCLVFENISSYYEFRVKENLDGWQFEGGAVYGGTADGSWDENFTVTEEQAYSPEFYMDGGDVRIEFWNSEIDISGNITVYKFYDANYDGVYQENPDYLIDGFEFMLWNATEEGVPIAELLEEPVETIGGTYTFEDLEPGYYVVQEIIREVEEGECCWLSTTGEFVEGVGTLIPVTVEAGETNETWFGNVRGGRIEGMKFLDVEATGEFEVGLDKPLMGWEIHLYEASSAIYRGIDADIWRIGDPVDTTETNRSGQYYFDCVMPGPYFVREEMYDGWYNVTPALQFVYVDPCTTTEDVDFANCMYKDIYGIKYHDVNATGEFDPEEDHVLEGWTIRLLDEEFEEIENTTTDHLGYYYFEGLTVGTYYVEEVIPEGEEDRWASSTESRVRVELNCCTPCTVVNFGNYERPEITIIKFEDTNMTGTYDEDDDELLDVAVLFDVDREDEFFAANISVTGEYTFYVDAFYNYTVTEQLPPGWHNTTDLVQSTEHPLGPGENYIFYFGNVRYGDLEVYKFYDTNMTGEYDEEWDVLLEGWTFNLWNVTNGDPDEVILTNVTDEDGLAMFESLESGVYAVEEIVQECWFPTTDVIQIVEIFPGETSELWFGNVPGGFIEGYKFCDYNLNQTFDEFEDGLRGWTINLYNYTENNNANNEEPYMSTTTDEYGYYNFTCIRPGMYILEEVMQEGWYNSTSYYYVVEVGPEDELRYDFGNYRYGNITGIKFFDFTMNGTFEPKEGDIPLRGRTVELWEADMEGNKIGDEPIDTTETDAHGYYIFEHVGPGDYVVYQPKPCCDWIHTTPREQHVRMGCVEEEIVNFGEYKLSSIDVYVICGWEGIEVTIYESDAEGTWGGNIESGYTGDHGWYISEHLEPGYYIVELGDGQYEHVQLRMGEQVEFEYDETPESTDSIATYAKIE